MLRKIRGIAWKAAFGLLIGAGLYVSIGAGRQFFLDEANSRKTVELENNMHALQVVLGDYAYQNNAYASNAKDLAALFCSSGEFYYPLKNPWTGKTGEGNAWVNGWPTKLGQVGYIAFGDTAYVIAGFYHDGLFPWGLSNRGDVQVYMNQAYWK